MRQRSHGMVLKDTLPQLKTCNPDQGSCELRPNNARSQENKMSVMQCREFGPGLLGFYRDAGAVSHAFDCGERKTS